MVSKELKIALKLGDEPMYRIAQKAGLNPSVLSKLLCGITEVKENDSRILAVGRVLGIPPEDCFQKEMMT